MLGSLPNDPLFILHYTVVDCMLDEWLEQHPDAQYPSDILKTVSTTGLRPDDYMVPFFPLSIPTLTCSDGLVTLDTFVICQTLQTTFQMHLTTRTFYKLMSYQQYDIILQC